MNPSIFPTSSKGFIAGIGSRSITSKESLFKIKVIFCMQLAGFHTNSGCADGDDTSSEYGSNLATNFRNKYLGERLLPFNQSFSGILPWDGFNGKYERDGYTCQIPDSAFELTAKFHKGWDYLPDPVKRLMARNALQVLGLDLRAPVKMILCSTPDAVFHGDQTTNKTGGTGQAIRIASSYNIPIFNTMFSEHRERLSNFIETMRIHIKSDFGVDIVGFIEDSYFNYRKSVNFIKADITELPYTTKNAIIVHGCNCQNVKGSAIAKSMFKKFPEAYEADQLTKKGDRKKLGTYSSANVGRNNNRTTIVNAYTQIYYGRDEDVLNADYEAIRKVFRKINTDFPKGEIFYPKIGAGLANGCFITINNIINHELSGRKHTLVEFDG